MNCRKITGIKPGSWASSVNYEGFRDFTADQAKIYLDSLATLHQGTEQGCFRQEGLYWSDLSQHQWERMNTRL